MSALLAATSIAEGRCIGRQHRADRRPSSPLGRPVLYRVGWAVSPDELIKYRVRVAAGFSPEQAAFIDAGVHQQTLRIEPQPHKHCSNPLHVQFLSQIASNAGEASGGFVGSVRKIVGEIRNE